MGAPRIGTRVVEGTRVGVVVDHRPQGMVDVCFEDSGIVERRPGTQLLAMNPATALAKTRLLDVSYEDSPAYYAVDPFSAKIGGKQTQFEGRWVMPGGPLSSVSSLFGEAVADFMSEKFMRGDTTYRPTEADREAIFAEVNRSVGSPFASLRDFENQQKRAFERFEAFMAAFYEAPQAVQRELSRALTLKTPLRKGVIDIRSNPKGDIYDPAEEQFRAVVQGVYESLVTKELGVSAFKDARGKRADEKALRSGRVSQADLRGVLSRAYAIATRQGQKYGYLEAGTQRPTKKGAALAAARYGADPKLVGKMLAGDAKAQKLAAKKSVEKLAENRQDYEITLQLVRKGGAPRVVEELVGGKLVSFQQPGAKRVFRGRNPWKPPEERGRARGMEDFPTKMVPYLEDARSLGKQKGQALRQLAQVRKEAAKKTLANALAQIETAFQKVSKDATDALGLDALDDRGLLRPQVRHALGVLRKVHEDTASEVQRGIPVRNPVGKRTKHIAKKGDGYHWSGVRTGRKSDFTPVVLYATSPAKDTARGVGFFSITFPPGRRDVVRALQEARGWERDPTVSGTKFETGIATEAPQIHKVLRYQGGGAAAKRGVGGQFGKGLYTVVGPRVPKRKDPPLFERKADATEYARTLDLKAVSFQVPQVHEIVQLSNGYYEVRGPRAEEEIAIRVERNKKRDERDAAPSEYENEDLLYEDEGEAQRVAESLDYREARSGVLPIAGYRTKRGLTGEKALEAYRNALARLDENKVFYKLHASTKAMGQPSIETRPFVREYALSSEEMAERIREQDKRRSDREKYYFDKGYSKTLDLKRVASLRKSAAKAAEEDFPPLSFAKMAVEPVKVRQQREKQKKHIDKRVAEGVPYAEAVADARSRFPLPGDPTTAQQKRLSERSPERLIATAVARGEDVDVLLPLLAEAEERGRNKLVNLLAKSYEEDATKVALKAASKKLGAAKVAGILSAPRDEVSMKARMPGAFVQTARAFGKQRRVSFKKQASDLDVVLAALYPKGDAPPTLLPKYDRDHLRDLDDEALAKLAKSKLGMSDKDIEKVLTSVERSVLSKIVAEQAPESTVGLIGRGGFDVEVPKAERRKAEAIERARRQAPKPLRPTALREKAEKARVEDRMAELDREIAELQAKMAAQQRKKNGALSVGVSAGLRAAKAGGQVAARYGKKAYSAARAWLSTGAGQKFVGEVSGIAVALFGAKAVSSGKLTREQAALVQHELERQTGRKADPARVAVALQIAGE